VGVQHAYPGGYLVHHLYTGVLIAVPAAFVLAFGARFLWVAVVTRLALGIGTGLILDEMTYLIMTGATDADYVSDVSLGGSVVLIGAGVLLALGLYKWHDCKSRKDSTLVAPSSP
jgi:hypothetical protein